MLRYVLLLAFLLLPTARAATAFVNVNVIPMDTERVVAGQTVVVDGGLITAIGAVDDVRVPPGATIVDGTDRFLMPGLGEMHAHVPAPGESLGRAQSRVDYRVEQKLLGDEITARSQIENWS